MNIPTNKINPTQKMIMLEFMLQHPELARSTMLNKLHGKKMAQRLWMILTKRLNAAGPPAKDVKVWRKVYADLKHHVKKKVETSTTAVLRYEEEQLMHAAGLQVPEDDSIAGATKRFVNRINNGIVNSIKEKYIDQHQEFDIIEVDVDVTEEDNCKAVIAENLNNHNHSNAPQPDGNGKDNNNINEYNNPAEDGGGNSEDEQLPLESMVALLNEQFHDFAEDQRLASAKLDRLIKMNEDLIRMKEKSLQMREEQHAMDMALKRMDLEIKTLELKAIQAKTSSVNIKTEEP